jgi:hypothetical protein
MKLALSRPNTSFGFGSRKLRFALPVLAAFLISSCSSSSTSCDKSSGIAEFGKSPHVVILLDDSSSMEYLASEVVEGFNNLISGLPQSATVSLYGFGTGKNLSVIQERQPASTFPVLNLQTYVPDGQTPLYDSVSNMLARFESESAIQRMKPTTFIIISDGGENSSISYSLNQTREKVKNAQSRGTKILFFALGTEAAEEAINLGIPASSTREFNPDSDGVEEVFDNIGGGFGQGVDSTQCQSLIP